MLIPELEPCSEHQNRSLDRLREDVLLHDFAFFERAEMAGTLRVLFVINIIACLRCASTGVLLILFSRRYNFSLATWVPGRLALRACMQGLVSEVR